MPLTANAQQLITNIKALSQPNVTILSNLLFRQPDRRYQMFAALFLIGSAKWVHPTTYASSFVNFSGASFTNTLSSVLTTSIASWTKADGLSLVEAFYKVNPAQNGALRNVLIGLLTGSRAAIQSTAPYIRIKADGTIVGPGGQPPIE